MSKRGLVLLVVVALLAFIAAPAMATPCTWIGGHAGDPTTFYEAANWSGGQPYHYPDIFIFNNSSTTNSMVNNGFTPDPGIISDSFNGGSTGLLGSIFSITNSGGSISPAGASVAAGCTLNLNLGGGGTPSHGTNPPTFFTWTIASTATLNLTNPAGGETYNVSGGGNMTLTRLSVDTGATASITGGTSLTLAGASYGYTFTSLTGDSTSSLNLSDTTADAGQVVINNNTFAGTINFKVGSGHPWAGYVVDNSTALTNLTLNLAGCDAGGATYGVGHSLSTTTGQTWNDGAITGDGAFSTTSDLFGNTNGGGSLIPMFAKGTTFQPLATNTAGSKDWVTSAGSNGVLFVVGKLVCAKDAASNNAQFKFAVMGSGTGGVFTAGTDYTAMKIARGNSLFGGINSVDNPGNNPLADADITINITDRKSVV